jgi:methyl-accepting chemotaxis protein
MSFSQRFTCFKPFQFFLKNGSRATFDHVRTGNGPPPASRWHLTISRRLALASLLVILLVAGLCAFSYRATGGLLQANNAISNSLERAAAVQTQASQLAGWVQQLNNTQAGMNKVLGEMIVDMTENQTRITAFRAGGQDPVGTFLESSAGPRIRELVTDSSGSFDTLIAQHQKLLAASQKITSVWQPRHDGLSEALSDTKRTINYWNLNVANTIFIRSSMLDLLSDELTDTPIERLRGSELYLKTAEIFPELQKTIEAAAKTNEKLYKAADELSTLMISGKWEEVRKHYRDTFPFMIKSILVDIDHVLAIEQQALNAQHQAMEIFNIELKQAESEIGAILTRLQDQLQQVAESQTTMVQKSNTEVLEKRQSMEAGLVNLRRTNLIAPVFVILLAITGSLVINRSVTRPLNLVVSRLASIASGEGDLTQRLPVYSGDEVGQLAICFNQFMDRQRDMVSHIRAVSEDLGGATHQILASATEVTSGALQQTKELEQSEESLRGIVTDINGIAESTKSLADSSRQCTSATLELGATIEEIAEQMENLFSSVEMVSTSTQEMSASSNQIEDNVQHLVVMSQQTGQAVSKLDERIAGIERDAMQAGTLSAQAAEDAGIGMAAVENSLDGINTISTVISKAGIVIRNLSEQSESIGQILTVIDDVADQTSLLALNATIIAAQAGEHGKGFAVVADEIRDLADRTAISTKEIAEIIRGLQNSAGEAVEVVENGQKRAGEEVARSQAAGQALSKIRQSTVDARTHVEGIVRAAHEQVVDSRQINTSSQEITQMLGHIAVALQQLSTGINQSARSTEEMREIAGRVKASTEEQAAGSRHISENMETIREMSQRIDSATQDQTLKSEQVVDAIVNINQVAKQTASHTHELDRVVALLSEQTRTLDSQVGTFKI